MPTIDSERVTLYYEQDGHGDPALVFLHGFGCDHRYFSPQFEYFGLSRMVVAFDMRGHGRSIQSSHSYAVRDFADDIIWAIERLGLAKPVVVGHSLGGAVTLELAARRPDLISGAILVDALVTTDEVRPGIRRVVDALKSIEFERVAQGLVDGLFATADDPQTRLRISEQMLSSPQPLWIDCFTALAEWDGASAAKSCEVPMLHIGAIVPSAEVQELNEAILTARTVGAGHFNQLEVPEQVNPMIEKFLSILVQFDKAAEPSTWDLVVGDRAQ